MKPRHVIEEITQVTHPHDQAEKLLFQMAALLNITGMIHFKVKRK